MSTFLSDSEREQIQYARKFFSWANKSWEIYDNGKQILPPMTEEEIWGVLQKCSRLMLNPSDQRQVQIWRDKNGIYVEPAYQIMVNWLDLQGGHTPPKFTRLFGDAAKAEGGTDPSDIIIRCSFVMDSDLPRLIALKQAGIDPQTALSMVEHVGIGRVTGKDYLADNGSEKAYSAPKGRTPADKARKRAFIDAISDMGRPSDTEFRALASLDRSLSVEPEDFTGTQSLSYSSARALATERARERETPALTDSESAEVVAALYGDEPEPEQTIVTESESAIEPEFEPEPQSEQPLPNRPADATMTMQGKEVQFSALDTKRLTWVSEKHSNPDRRELASAWLAYWQAVGANWND